jgi:hypothetical protein
MQDPVLDPREAAGSKVLSSEQNKRQK